LSRSGLVEPAARAGVSPHKSHLRSESAGIAMIRGFARKRVAAESPDARG
jgi:hypothetical protein